MTNLNTNNAADKSSPRWGIFALALLMFLVTTIGGIGGKPNAFYLTVWLFVAYYAYKGNTAAIYGWMKFVLILNVVVFLGVALFASDKIFNLMGYGSLADFFLAILVPFAVKAGLFLYLFWEKPEDVSPSKPSQSPSPSPTPPAAKNIPAPRSQRLPESMEVAYSAVYELPKATQDALKTRQSEELTPLKPSAEDEESAYEQAGDEIDKGTYRKGLWTKLWAESDGDERKVKVAYIKLRVPQILEEKSQARAENLKAALAEKLASEREQAYQDELARVRLREGQAAADRLHITELIKNPEFRENVTDLVNDAKRFRESSESRVRLLKFLGGKFEWDPKKTAKAGSVVTFAGTTHSFDTLEKFCDWVDSSIVNEAERALAVEQKI